MLKSIVQNTKIKGISTVAPKAAACLLDDPDLYGGDLKKIKRVIESSGFKYRRVAPDNVTSSDLCFEAAGDLIKNLKIDKASIDGIVFVSSTPDYFLPPTACVLHHRLGLKPACVMFDVNQGCAGYVYGLWIASLMLNANIKRVLLLVGDTFNKYTDMFRNHTAPVFGDAGSATLLDYDTQALPMYFDIGSQSENYEGIICRNGAFRNPPKNEDFYDDGSFKYDSSMDGMKVFKFTSEKVPQSILNVLAIADTKVNELDYCILHQANKFILQNIAQLIDLPLEKMPSTTLTEYGNQSSASIPGAICDSIQNIVTTRPTKLLLSGFGVGLSWMSCVLNLDQIYCSKILEYI